MVLLVAELLRDPVRELPELDAVKTFLPSKLTCEFELFPFTAFLIFDQYRMTQMIKEIKIRMLRYVVL